MVTVLFGALYRPLVTGDATLGQFQRARVLWDWLNLLLVLGILAVSAYLFNSLLRRTEHSREDQRIQAEREIASSNLQEAALEAYLDRMTRLLLDKELLASKPTDVVHIIARAQTLTIVRKLDGARKGTLLRYLHELGLLEKEPLMDLAGADLSGADLTFGTLSGTNLSGVDLSKANLWMADLRGSTLARSNLSRVDARGANFNDDDLTAADLGGATLPATSLNEAKLVEADLSGATLTHADLGKADLTRAYLNRAYAKASKLGNADLRWARMQEATLSEADLRAAVLLEATL